MDLLDKVGKFAAAYLDNVVIYSKTWEDHIRYITDIMTILRDAGLTVKSKKCQFAMSQCAYLGHVVGNSEVRPEQMKLQAVEDFPQPKTK